MPDPHDSGYARRLLGWTRSGERLNFSRPSIEAVRNVVQAGWIDGIGRIGTAYENTLMESTIGLFKTELIHRRQTGWQSRQEVETATARWVTWFNRNRLHSELGHFTPIEVAMEYLHQQSLPRQAA